MPSNETASPTPVAEIEAAEDQPTMAQMIDWLDASADSMEYFVEQGVRFPINLGDAEMLRAIRSLLAEQEAERRDSERWRAVVALNRDGRLSNFLSVCNRNDVPLDTGMDALLSREPSLAAIQSTPPERRMSETTHSTVPAPAQTTQRDAKMDAMDRSIATPDDLEQARKLMSAMCHGEIRKWRMCIPVQPDDSDMIWARTILTAARYVAIKPALDALAEAVTNAEAAVGCGDNSCLFRTPTGMATNGGCRCGKRGLTMARLATVLKAASTLTTTGAEHA